MTTWNEFVKEIAQKHGLSRKEAMKKASPLWKKKKQGKQPVKDVPEISEFPKQIKKSKKDKLPRATRTKTIRASEFGGRIDIAAPQPKKGYARMRKKHMVLSSNSFGFLNR